MNRTFLALLAVPFVLGLAVGPRLDHDTSVPPPVSSTTTQPPSSAPEPTSPSGGSTTTTPGCQEDDPCWDCRTMGNQVCGPVNLEVQKDRDDYTVTVWDANHVIVDHVIIDRSLYKPEED